MVLVKDVVSLACELIGLDDVSSELKDAENAKEKGEDFSFSSPVKKKIDKLLKCVSLTADRIASNYLSMNTSDEMVSDFQGKISYDEFSHNVIDVITVSDASSEALIKFNALPFHIYLPYKNRRVIVDYRFSPKAVKSIDEYIALPPIISKRTIAFGIVSDFLLSKNIYDESKFWNEKFEKTIISEVSRKHKLYLAPKKFL